MYIVLGLQRMKVIKQGGPYEVDYIQLGLQ